MVQTIETLLRVYYAHHNASKNVEPTFPNAL
jgi:hypothetical protein